MCGLHSCFVRLRWWMAGLLGGTLVLPAGCDVGPLAPDPTGLPRALASTTPKSRPVEVGRDGNLYRYLPASGRAEIGVPYEFSLWAHCGADFLVDFDSSFWRATKVTGPALGDPEDFGTMMLLSRDVAEYESYGGGVIRFRRVIGGTSVPGCS